MKLSDDDMEEFFAERDNEVHAMEFIHDNNNDDDGRYLVDNHYCDDYENCDRCGKEISVREMTLDDDCRQLCGSCYNYWFNHCL